MKTVVCDAVLLAAFVSPPMPVGRVVASMTWPPLMNSENVAVVTAPGASTNPEFEVNEKPPATGFIVQSAETRLKLSTEASAGVAARLTVKVICPVVGALPTFEISTVYVASSIAVVGPWMFGVRSGTATVVVVTGDVAVVAEVVVVTPAVVGGATVVDDGQAAASARPASLTASAAPTANTTTTATPPPTPRRRISRRSRIPPPSKPNANSTNTSVLLPVLGSGQSTISPYLPPVA
ncbi:MAG TPA: hypothetical protein VHI95_03375 [Acidimicrobiales bacterium]|nr:hypothetical protein [Acidimicrobiales bacterium]